LQILELLPNRILMARFLIAPVIRARILDRHRRSCRRKLVFAMSQHEKST